MSTFTLEAFRAAAEQRYGGVKIDDAPNGPLTLRPIVMLTDDTQRAAVKAAIQNLSNVQSDSGTDENADPGSELDKLPAVGEALVNLLATVADRPDDFRAYVTDMPLAVLLSVKDAWEAASDPKAA